jgi:putative transposase
MRDWAKRLAPDFATLHPGYACHNPVRHGYVNRVHDWSYSLFHRMVRLGVYPLDWAGDTANDGTDFGER